MYVEQKWKINREKNEHARTCPGFLPLDQIRGKTVLDTFPLTLPDQTRLTILLFEQGRFSVVEEKDLQPAQMLPVLEAVRKDVEQHHPDFYRKLDSLAEEDRRMQVLARMENILGAIRNNVPQNPELLSSIKNLIAEMDAGLSAPGCSTGNDQERPENRDKR